MIYITGDCHGNFGRFDPSIFPEQREMTKEDYNKRAEKPTATEVALG